MRYSKSKRNSVACCVSSSLSLTHKRPVVSFSTSCRRAAFHYKSSVESTHHTLLVNNNNQGLPRTPLLYFSFTFLLLWRTYTTYIGATTKGFPWNGNGVNRNNGVTKGGFGVAQPQHNRTWLHAFYRLTWKKKEGKTRFFARSCRATTLANI